MKLINLISPANGVRNYRYYDAFNGNGVLQRRPDVGPSGSELTDTSSTHVQRVDLPDAPLHLHIAECNLDFIARCARHSLLTVE